MSLSAGAFDAPGATGTDAATCVSHAQSDDDLTACETRALAATKDVACTAVSAAIRPGTEVDVLDDGDKVLAIGRLGRGRTTDSGHTCTYPFTAASVPSTGRVYGLRIGPVGAPTHYTKQELFGHPVVLSVD